MRARRAVLLLSALPLVAAPGATAQVIEDPDSPAGVEYALPLEGAREEAAPRRDRSEDGAGSGEDTANASGDADAPLFGSGLSAESEDRSTGGGDSGRPREQSSGESSVERDVSAAVTPPLTDEGGSATLPIVGLGVATLLLGAGIGLLVRRHRRAG